MSISSNSTPLSKSSIYKWIELGKYDNAQTLLNTKEDLYKLFEKVNDLNCMHLLLKQDLTEGTKAQKLFNKIINDLKVSEDKTLLANFQEIFPFKYTLQLGLKENFYSLLNNQLDLLKKKEISECLDFIVQNDFTDQCETLINKLTKKDIEVIVDGSPSPFVQSIRKNCPAIFKIFLYRLHEAICKDREILSSLKNKKIEILSEIAAQEHGEDFLKILLNQPLPKIMSGEANETFASEIIDHINDAGSDKKTPLGIAVIKGNESLIEKLLQLGADPSLLSNGKRPIDLTLVDEAKNLLEKAEYGCIQVQQEAPLKLKRIFIQRKQRGLINCCKEGKVQLAIALIKDYQVPLIDEEKKPLVDQENNSLLMMLLNSKAPSEEIVNFMKILGEDHLNLGQENKAKNNILTLAATSKDHNLVIRHLLNYYFDQFKMDHKNKKGETILKISENLNNLEILEILSQKYQMTSNSEQGNSILSSLFANLKNFQEKFLKMEENFKEKERIHEKKLLEQQNFYQKALDDQKLQFSEMEDKLTRERSKVEKLSEKLESFQKKFLKVEEGFTEKEQADDKKVMEIKDFCQKALNAQKLEFSQMQEKFTQEQSQFESSHQKLEDLIKIQEMLKNLEQNRSQVSELKTNIVTTNKEITKLKKAIFEEEEKKHCLKRSDFSDQKEYISYYHETIKSTYPQLYQSQEKLTEFKEKKTKLVKLKEKLIQEKDILEKKVLDEIQKIMEQFLI